MCRCSGTVSIAKRSDLVLTAIVEGYLYVSVWGSCTTRSGWRVSLSDGDGVVGVVIAV
jgi:hypothetical protein